LARVPLRRASGRALGLVGALGPRQAHALLPSSRRQRGPGAMLIRLVFSAAVLVAGAGRGKGAAVPAAAHGGCRRHAQCAAAE
jgi:hypothetical protein